MTPEAAGALVAHLKDAGTFAVSTLAAEGHTRHLAQLATLFQSLAQSARDRIAMYPPQVRKPGGNDGGLA